MITSYDFKDIESLNSSMKSSSGSAFANMGGNTESAYFEIKGKKTLIYTGTKSLDNENSTKSEMESMKDYYKYELSFKFDRNIKKTSNDKAIISSNKKTVQIKGSIFDVIHGGYCDIKIKLK